MTLEEVGKVFGITKERVRQITKGVPVPSIPRKTRPPKYDNPSTIEKILILGQDLGLTGREIAKKTRSGVDYTQGVLFGRIHPEIHPGLPRRRYGQPLLTHARKVFIATVGDLLSTGVSAQTVAKRLNVPIHKINYLVYHSSVCPWCHQEWNQHTLGCVALQWREKFPERIWDFPRKGTAFLEGLLKEGPLTWTSMVKKVGISSISLLRGRINVARRKGLVKVSQVGRNHYWSLVGGDKHGKPNP
jgi:hypothetical protein